MLKTIHRLLTKKNQNGDYKVTLSVIEDVEQKPIVKPKKEKNSNPKFTHVKTRIKKSRSNGYKFYIQYITCIDKHTGELINKEIIHRPL
jgi:hypothetical protein